MKKAREIRKMKKLKSTKKRMLKMRRDNRIGDNSLEPPPEYVPFEEHPVSSLKNCQSKQVSGIYSASDLKKYRSESPRREREETSLNKRIKRRSIRKNTGRQKTLFDSCKK